MKFYGHLVGGVIVGAGVCVVGYLTGELPLGMPPLFNGFKQTYSIDPSFVALFGLFMVTCVMALFPDLDTSSIPQRWFYRIVFIALVGMLVLNRLDLFSILTLIALAPLLHRHRGWTHSKIAPWLIALMTMMILEYYRSQQSWLGGFSIDRIVSGTRENWLYVLACVGGHYTHLYLDKR